MTEDELFAAVHEYANTAMFFIEGGGHHGVLHNEDAQNKLLAAIDKWSFKRAFLKTHPSYQVLLAKQAVCDAFLGAPGEDYDRNIGKAVRELHELESKT